MGGGSTPAQCLRLMLMPLAAALTRFENLGYPIRYPMCFATAAPNSLHLTSVAPSIWRSKS